MSGQDAINALRAKQGINGSIDPNFHADTLQLVLDDVMSLAISRTVGLEYDNQSPVIGTEYDTAYNPPTNIPTLELTVLASITAGGDVYAVFVVASVGALVSNPDVRIPRHIEFTGVTGSATITTWYDSVTSSIHATVEIAGGGKVLNAIQVVSAFNSIVIVP